MALRTDVSDQPVVLVDSDGNEYNGGNPLPVDLTVQVNNVHGEDALAELTFKTSGGDVAIPSTPTAYAQGQVIGTQFSLPSMARENGAFLLVASAVLREILGASAYSGTSVTADASANTIGLTSHTLVNGNKVKFGGTAVPGGLLAGQTYYVVNKATSTFQVAASYGGSAIDLTDAGTAVTVTEVPMQAPCLLFLSPVALAAVANAATYAPALAEAEKLTYPVVFSVYQQAGLQSLARDDGYQQLVQADAADTALYGVLVYNGTGSGVLSKQAELRLSVYAVRD